MQTIILDGNLLSQNIKTEIAAEVTLIRDKGGRAPHLAAVLVGDNPASEVYVRNKIKSCETVGFESTLIRLDSTATEAEVLAVVEQLNADAGVDGFIVQLPLPPQIDADTVTLAIDHRKDVDGFHPINFGRMAQGMPAFLPATPFGILEILRRYNIETKGKSCVVIGRSNIVGTPMSLLMSRRGYPGDCTVTLAHSQTKDLTAVCAAADILIAAIGKPDFVTADMVKPGAVVIDVGINRVPDASKKSGYRIVGDVHFESVAPKAKAITPVPGGVGAMTVTALMLNTLKSYKKEIYAV